MDDTFIEHIYNSHNDCVQCPSKEDVSNFYTSLLGTLFPNYSNQTYESLNKFNLHILNLREELYEILYTQLLNSDLDAHVATKAFFDAIPGIYEKLQQDIIAMFDGDPAATSTDEVVRSYPGFYAIAAYRLAHELAKSGVQIIPRMFTEHAHSVTGIDIHPNAEIGNHFCIDHGTGIVIGETTSIGNHVKIYQGVTLGALSVKKEDAKTKRHPTIEDHVVIYSGATILGGKTIIGEKSIIGGNVWITESVSANTKVYYLNKVITEGGENIDTTTIKNIAP